MTWYIKGVTSQLVAKPSIMGDEKMEPTGEVREVIYPQASGPTIPQDMCGHSSLVVARSGGDSEPWKECYQVWREREMVCLASPPLKYNTRSTGNTSSATVVRRTTQQRAGLIATQLGHYIGYRYCHYIHSVYTPECGQKPGGPINRECNYGEPNTIFKGNNRQSLHPRDDGLHSGWVT